MKGLPSNKIHKRAISVGWTDTEFLYVRRNRNFVWCVFVWYRWDFRFHFCHMPTPLPAAPDPFWYIFLSFLGVGLPTALLTMLLPFPALVAWTQFEATTSSTSFTCFNLTKSFTIIFPRSLVILLAQKEDPDTLNKVQNLASIDTLLSNAQIDATSITKGTTVISAPSAVTKILTQWTPYRKKCKELRGKV